MSAAIPITRLDRSASELRNFASKCNDGARVRRVLAIAMVLDGRSRAEAAELNSMDRQTLSDWVHRYNATCELACNNDPLRGVFRVQSRPL
jgi:hypothetical protein